MGGVRIDWRTGAGAELFWLGHASVFQFRLRRDEHEHNDFVFGVEQKSRSLWAVTVTVHGSVLDKKSNEFVYEPFPSNRTEEFLKRTRFRTKESALKALQKFVRKKFVRTTKI